MTAEELITIEVAAKVLKVHPMTIRRYIREGKLTQFKTLGDRKHRVPRQQVEALKEPQPVAALKA